MVKLNFRNLAVLADIIVIIALSSCQRGPLDNVIPSPGGSGNMKQVYFKAGADSYDVKSTLVPNEEETLFHSTWETGDKLYLQYTRNGVPGSATSEEWDENNGFAVTLPDEGPADWTYSALSPVPDELGGYSFSSDFTDDPLMSPSCREILCSDIVEATGAEPGKDALGNDISLHMRRLTTAIYFHVTSEELAGNKVRSVSISARGKQPLWAKRIITGMDESGNVFLKPADNIETYNKVSIYYSSNKPDIKDFTVLFNVLPFEFEGLELVVTLEDNRSFVIERNSSGIYEAGKLYRIKKEFSSDNNFIIKYFANVSHEPFSFNGLIVSGDGNSNEGYGEDVVIPAETKCIFGPELDGTYKIRFQAGDEVSVFDGINSSIFKATSTADVTVLSNGEIRQSLQHLMLYPVNENAYSARGRIYTEIPPVQNAVSGGFDKQALVSTALSSSGDIVFRNVTAMLRFTTTGHWDKMVLTTMKGECVAGGVYINAESDEPSIIVDPVNISSSITLLNESDAISESMYYLCIEPLTFKDQSGFTVEFYDGEILLETKKFNYGKMALNRSEIMDIGYFVFSNGFRPGEVAMGITDSGNYFFFADRNCGAKTKYDPGLLYTRDEAIAFLNGAGNGWRLPTAGELEHLWVNSENKYIWNWVSDENFRGWTVHYGYEEHFIYLPVPDDPVYYWTSDTEADDYELLHAKRIKYRSTWSPDDGPSESEWTNYFPGATFPKYYVRAVREVEP